MRRKTILLALVILVFTSMNFASAHVPILGEGGTSPDTAIEVEDASKSVVIYSELSEAAAPHYYYIHMEGSSRLRTTINLPLEYANTDFNPTLVLMGHDLGVNHSIPDFIELPEGLEAMVFQPEPPVAVYEGFTPSAFLVTINIDMTLEESGHYYLVIYDASSGGRYSITLGYAEIFNLDEWLLVPFNVISIHLWSGQPLWLILLPTIAVPLLGVMLIGTGKVTMKRREDPLVWIGSIASLLILSSGIMIYMQLLFSTILVGLDAQVVITFLFGLLPLLFGLIAFNVITSYSGTLTKSRATKLIIAAILSLFVWGGYIIGPLILIAFSLTAYARSKPPELDMTQN